MHPKIVLKKACIKRNTRFFLLCPLFRTSIDYFPKTMEGFWVQLEIIFLFLSILVRTTPLPLSSIMV